MKTHIIRAVVAGLALLCATPQAFAAEPPLLEAQVSYDDLNINENEGAVALLQRIEAAAIAVCGGRDGITRDLARRAQRRACALEATDAAVARLNAPLVTALHRNGRSDLRRTAQREDGHG
jgi:UrcA family protein